MSREFASRLCNLFKSGGIYMILKFRNAKLKYGFVWL